MSSSILFQRESVRESLKNMLLVMNTTGLFESDQALAMITKDRIHSFLPGLWQEVFTMSTPLTINTDVRILFILLENSDERSEMILLDYSETCTGE